MTRGAFAFTKWYLDCLDEEGRLLILYWATLEWRRLKLTWHSVARCEPGAQVQTRSSVRPCAAPVQSPGVVRWKSEVLDCEVELVGGGSGIATQQLADGVAWTAVAPGSHARVRLGDTEFHGTGYAEHFTLRVAPWTLGLHQLRWGRWISSDATRSAVWIQWNGSPDTQWVFLDGARANATVDDDSVTASGATLALDPPRVVVDRSLGATVNRIPALRAVAPRWLVAGKEERRTRPGTLREGRTETQGTAVDEVVDFG